jgi:hypothetical protein
MVKTTAYHGTGTHTQLPMPPPLGQQWIPSSGIITWRTDMAAALRLSNRSSWKIVEHLRSPSILPCPQAPARALSQQVK